MRFGFVARFTLALAIFAIAIFLIHGAIEFRQPSPPSPLITPKQELSPKSALPDFAAISDIRMKKMAFFQFISPGIVTANRKISRDRQFLLDVRQSLLSSQEILNITRLNQIAAYYRLPLKVIDVARLDTLLLRVDTIPADLIMVQAANESGWGTSRFARLGLNFFGQWCFSKGCGLIPSSRNDDASHEVQVFDSVEQSITSYLRNLNTHPAYQHLRQIRGDLRANHLPVQAQYLVVGLRNYSQRQDDYVIELLKMLRNNKAYL